MAIFRGVGGSGDSSDNSFLDAVTAQANAASASATAASTSASAASTSASSILNLTAATGAAGTEASYNASTGILTIPRGDTGDINNLTSTAVTNVLTGGTGISIASNGTITNDSPDQTVALTGSGAITITGTYPNFTVTSNAALLTGATFTGNVNVFLDTNPIYTTSPLLTNASSTTYSIAEITDIYYASLRSALNQSPLGDWDDNRRAVQILFNFNGTGHSTAGQKGWSSADQSVVSTFINDTYPANDVSTFQSSLTAMLNGTYTVQTTIIDDILDGDYDHLVQNSNEGNIEVDGTVDGRDLSVDGTKLDGIEANADVTDTANVTAAGALMDSEVTNLTQVKAFDSSDYATAAQGTLATNALPKSGGQMTGNITFSGSQTVDGRDLSVDGIKLDTIEAGATADQTGAEIKTAYEAEANTNAFTDADHTKLDGLKGTLTQNYWDSMQWAQGATRALTTTLTQYGDTLFVKHQSGTYKTYVDLSLDLIHNNTSGTNDAYGHLAVSAPAPAGETTVNMGACTHITSGISYIRAFTLVGDWTEYFSPYIGISKNSDGSSPMSHPYKWYYNPYANLTTVWVSLYTNAPSNGDTIYLHPFDWESSGTVINGETLTLDGSSDTSVNNRRDFKIYLGRFNQRVSYKFLARENSSTDTVSLDTLRMSTTEYEA